MSAVPTDPRHREVYDLAVRIGLAWRELRRGSATSGLRDYLYGSDDESIEQGQMDTLDLLALQPAWRMSELAEARREVFEAVAARRAELLTFILKKYTREELPIFADMLERFVVSVDTFVASHHADT